MKKDCNCEHCPPFRKGIRRGLNIAADYLETGDVMGAFKNDTIIHDNVNNTTNSMETILKLIAGAIRGLEK